MHVPMGRTHRESSMSKLDYDTKRVANMYMELLPLPLALFSGMQHNSLPVDGAYTQHVR